MCLEASFLLSLDFEWNKSVAYFRGFWRKGGVGKTKAIEITCWLRVNKSLDYTAESWKFTNTSFLSVKRYQLFLYCATWKCMRISNKPFVLFLWTLHSRLKLPKNAHSVILIVKSQFCEKIENQGFWKCDFCEKWDLKK